MQQQQEQQEQQAPAPDNLVPIRLDLTVDGHRVHDRFCWDANDTTLTPTAFATQLAADLGHPPSLVPPIAEQITEQLDLHSSSTAAATPTPSADRRHVVRLDVRIGRVVLRDMFEWDLSSRHNNPDAFAERLCADVGLRSEHVSAVSHALRAQLADLAALHDDTHDRRAVHPSPSLLPADVVRAPRDAERWQPRLQCLTNEQRERLERKEKRDARLQRRNRGKADTGIAGGVSRPRSSGARARRASGAAGLVTPGGRRRR